MSVATKWDAIARRFQAYMKISTPCISLRSVVPHLPPVKSPGILCALLGSILSSLSKSQISSQNSLRLLYHSLHARSFLFLERTELGPVTAPSGAFVSPLGSGRYTVGGLPLNALVRFFPPSSTTSLKSKTQ